MEFQKIPVTRTEFKDPPKSFLTASILVEVVLLEQSSAAPCLYQLKRENLIPIESIQKLKEELRSTNDAFHLLGEVKEIKADKKIIILKNGTLVVYKFLILVTGYHTSADLGPAMTFLKDALLLDCLKVQEKLPLSSPTPKQSTFTLCTHHPDLQKMVDTHLTSPSSETSTPHMVARRSLHVQIS